MVDYRGILFCYCYRNLKKMFAEKKRNPSLLMVVLSRDMVRIGLLEYQRSYSLLIL